jgi:hypothetical protein
LNERNRIIIAVAVAFTIVNILLSITGQSDLAVYFVINAIAYFVVLLANINLVPRARPALTALSSLIFTGFLVVIVMKVSQMMG